MVPRVGPLHWLMLGALAQMPQGCMHARDLSHHMRHFAPGAPIKRILDLLEDRGMISLNHAEGRVWLQEKGAVVLRQSGRTNNAHFARVSDAVVYGETL